MQVLNRQVFTSINKRENYKIIKEEIAIIKKEVLYL